MPAAVARNEETAPLRGPSGQRSYRWRGWSPCYVPTLAGRQGGFHLTRVAAYIDGFNLYHGLRSKHGHKYLWLDLELLVTKLLKPHQELAVVRYFTASVRNDAPTLARQSSYLGALDAHAPRLDIRLGRFQEKSLRCHRCGAAWRTYGRRRPTSASPSRW